MNRTVARSQPWNLEGRITDLWMDKDQRVRTYAYSQAWLGSKRPDREGTFTSSLLHFFPPHPSNATTGKASETVCLRIIKLCFSAGGLLRADS